MKKYFRFYLPRCLLASLLGYILLVILFYLDAGYSFKESLLCSLIEFSIFGFLMPFLEMKYDNKKNRKNEKKDDKNL